MNDDPHGRRITQLEELLTHQERLVQQLNDVVVDLRRTIERLEGRLDRQQVQLGWLLENRPDGGLPPNEKPPHY